MNEVTQKVRTEAVKRRTTTSRARPTQAASVPARDKSREQAPKKTDSSTGSTLAVTAKTAAGAGIALVVVLAGAATAGLALEAIIIPSLLVKVAAGLAGGGVGMAKGIKDERKVG